MHIKKNAFLGAWVAALLFQYGWQAEAQVSAPREPKHCFWKVQGKSNEVYLLGSIHVLNNKYYPLDKPIEEAFKKANTLVLEVDLKEMESREAQLKMLKMGRYADGDSLKKHLSPETYQTLDARIRKTGGSAAMFDPFKPWMVAVVLVAAELKKLGFNPEEGVDHYFYQKASAERKQVLGLETSDFQLGLFNEFTREEGESMLKETFGEIDNLKNEFEDLLKAWKKGDTEKLDKTMVEEMRGYPEIYKKLLVERNQRWARQMDAFLTKGTDVFVVVGAAHLVGKDSLIGMLQKRGYKVDQE
jgi:uncharacterized protein YbaP (TraB family)